MAISNETRSQQIFSLWVVHSGLIDGYDEAVKNIKLRLKIIAVENQEMDVKNIIDLI